MKGSAGAVPDTNTSPPAFTAWLYIGGGFAAFGVKTICLVVECFRLVLSAGHGRKKVYGLYVVEKPNNLGVNDIRMRDGRHMTKASEPNNLDLGQ